MKTIRILLFSIMLFCCFVSVNVFAQGKEHNEITIAILKGDNLSEYKDLLSKTIKEKLNKTVKIKVLDYDTFYKIAMDEKEDTVAESLYLLKESEDGKAQCYGLTHADGSIIASIAESSTFFLNSIE